MRKSAFFFVLAAVMTLIGFPLGACSDKKPAADTTVVDSIPADTVTADTLETLISETPMPKAADELFDDFIFNFAANRKLQLARIKFPLAVENGGRVTYLDRKHWRMEHFFMRQGYYTLILDNQPRDHREDLLQEQSTHTICFQPVERPMDDDEYSAHDRTTKSECFLFAILRAFLGRQRFSSGQYERFGRVYQPRSRR